MASNCLNFDPNGEVLTTAPVMAADPLPPAVDMTQPLIDPNYQVPEIK